MLGKDLPGEILGKVNLGDMAFELTRRLPNDKESRLFNAMVVTLVEHGITLSALAARSPTSARPEAMQAAVAAGLAARQRIRRLDGRRRANAFRKTPTWIR